MFFIVVDEVFNVSCVFVGGFIFSEGSLGVRSSISFFFEGMDIFNSENEEDKNKDKNKNEQDNKSNNEDENQSDGEEEKNKH